MKRLLGLLGSWALLVLALGLATYAVAGEWINLHDQRRIDRLAVIDELIRERTGNKAEKLRAVQQRREAELNVLQNKVATVAKQTDDVPDTGQTILVSTAENRLYLRRNGQTIFEAVCSTGKGTTLAVDGKTLVFDTPIGKFHIKAKEENPLWVPPDWHFVEEASRERMRVVHLDPGAGIDADTGQPARPQPTGLLAWLRGDKGGSRRVLRVRGDTVVESDNGVERELPPGKTIVAGNAVIVPPVNTKQRHYDKILGHFRLELGDGYGIHGTDEPDKLGRSVSHGCVRLGDDDIAKLYAMANVGDEVIIY
jgi:lipoprotein-anchoring transpeptidase ErfK/SrfK